MVLSPDAICTGTDHTERSNDTEIRQLSKDCSAPNGEIQRKENSCSGHSKSKHGQSESEREEECLEISSPCAGSYTRVALPYNKSCADDKKRFWMGFCACCKRPLSIETRDEPEHWKRRRLSPKEGSCAYVIALWGPSAEYVLGAMVLGKSLRKTGTKHDLVLLHTDDVIPSAIALLKRSGWIPRRIEHIDASESLYRRCCLQMRFAKVFTKLHVFALVDYAKVLMMDIDLLVQDNIDDLFDLPAPAALVRGPRTGYSHGEAVRGSRFFSGGSSEPEDCHWGWGQSSGINAGVMLLKPDMAVFNQMLLEVKQPHHPEHIRGNGPEQDYLSRFFADCWTHISVAYNFQLHQMWFNLCPAQIWNADRREFIENSDRIKVIHYSGELKPWSRFLESRYEGHSDEDWLDEALKNERGYCAWVLKEPEQIRHEARHDNLIVGPDGTTVHWPVHSDKSWHNDDGTASRLVNDFEKSGEVSAVPELGPALEVPDFAVKGAIEATRMSYKCWDAIYKELTEELEEPNLAKLVLVSVTDTEVTDENRASKTNAYDGWSKESGWWVEKPMNAQAIAYCGNVPKPYVVFTVDGTALLTESCPGVHAACVTESESIENDKVRQVAHTFTGPDAVSKAGDWVASLAEDSLVIIAAVVSNDDQRDSASQIFNAFSEGGLKCPTAMPSGVSVAAAIGQKGSTFWRSQAAVDQVMVSMFTRTASSSP